MFLIQLQSIPVKYVSSIDAMRAPFFTQDKEKAMTFGQEDAVEYGQWLHTNHGYVCKIVSM